MFRAYISILASLMLVFLFSLFLGKIISTSPHDSPESTVSTPLKDSNTPEQTSNDAVETADETNMKRFIERVFSYRDPMSGEYHQASVHLNVIPAGLEVIAPPESQLIGSYETRSDRVSVIFDSTSTADQVYAYYQSVLTERGWTQWEPPSITGFSASLQRSQRTFCSTISNQELHISAYELPGRPTDVRLMFRPEAEYSQCNQPLVQMGTPNPELAPSLSGPPGALVTSMRGGGNDWEYSISATVIETVRELTASEILETYNLQLADEGWAYKQSLSEAVYSWSSWSFSDENGNPYDSFLYVIQDANNEDRYYVDLQIIREGTH